MYEAIKLENSTHVEVKEKIFMSQFFGNEIYLDSFHIQFVIFWSLDSPFHLEVGLFC